MKTFMEKPVLALVKWRKNLKQLESNAGVEGRFCTLHTEVKNLKSLQAIGQEPKGVTYPG